MTPRAAFYARNRLAAYYRAWLIKRLRASDHSFSFIAELFLISRQRAQQIAHRPLPPAQMMMPFDADL